MGDVSAFAVAAYTATPPATERNLRRFIELDDINPSIRQILGRNLTWGRRFRLPTLG
jgi:hypothetical protein